MFPEVAEPIAGITAPGKRAILPGFTRYTVQQREHGNYPAVVRDDTPKAEVIGCVYEGVTAEQLKRTDWFEGTEYELYIREKAEAVVEGKSMTVFVYTAGAQLVSKLEGEWDPDVFKKEELGWYLENVVNRSVESSWYQENVKQQKSQ